jgi:hypothetical protein
MHLLVWCVVYRLSTTVLNGLKAILTNFTGVAGQLSGPVAIVAAGSEIAKTDSAGLFQVRCGQTPWGCASVSDQK